MTHHATTPTIAIRPSLALRILFSMPLIGTIARDISRDVNNVFYALVILLTVVVLAVKTWGLVALAMAALAMVPVMLITLILITRG